MRQRVFGHFCGIAAYAAKEVLFGVAPALRGHFAENGNHRRKQALALRFGQVPEFALRMDARRKQDVLQNAVAKTGKALLRREKRLCAERTRAFGKHLSEMRRKVCRKRRHRRVPLLRRTHKAVFRHKAAPFRTA